MGFHSSFENVVPENIQIKRKIIPFPILTKTGYRPGNWYLSKMEAAKVPESAAHT
jgi:hypothetical protein